MYIKFTTIITTNPYYWVLFHKNDLNLLAYDSLLYYERVCWPLTQCTNLFHVWLHAVHLTLIFQVNLSFLPFIHLSTSLPPTHARVPPTHPSLSHITLIWASDHWITPRITDRATTLCISLHLSHVPLSHTDQSDLNSCDRGWIERSTHVCDHTEKH